MFLLPQLNIYSVSQNKTLWVALVMLYNTLRPTYCSLSSSGGHQQHQNVLSNVRLELVKVSRPVPTLRQINLQTETLFTLEAGPLGRDRKGIPVTNQTEWGKKEKTLEQ